MKGFYVSASGAIQGHHGPFALQHCPTNINGNNDEQIRCHSFINCMHKEHNDLPTYCSLIINKKHPI